MGLKSKIQRAVSEALSAPTDLDSKEQQALPGRNCQIKHKRLSGEFLESADGFLFSELPRLEGKMSEPDARFCLM